MGQGHIQARGNFIPTQNELHPAFIPVADASELSLIDTNWPGAGYEIPDGLAVVEQDTNTAYVRINQQFVPLATSDKSPLEMTDFRFRHDVHTGSMEAWYIAGGVLGTSLGGVAFASDFLWCVPFVSPVGGTLDRLGFRVSSAGAPGDLAVVGIYDSVSQINPYPNNLLVQGSEQDTSSTGMKTDNISLEIEPGKLYWFVFHCNNASTTTQILGIAGQYVTGLGAVNSGLTAPLIQLLNTSLTYSPTLPSVFPATGSQLDSNPIPIIGVRYSS